MVLGTFVESLRSLIDFFAIISVHLLSNHLFKPHSKSQSATQVYQVWRKNKDIKGGVRDEVEAVKR